MDQPNEETISVWKTGDVDKFMESPLVQWVKTFKKSKEGLDFDELNDSVLLLDVLVTIDGEGDFDDELMSAINRSASLDRIGKMRNWMLLIRTLHRYYFESLQQLVVLPWPDVYLITDETDKGGCMMELQKFLVLILGYAVQCDKKENYVEEITNFSLDTQQSLANHIQQITDCPKNILSIGENFWHLDTETIRLILIDLCRERLQQIEKLTALSAAVGLDTNIDLLSTDQQSQTNKTPLTLRSLSLNPRLNSEDETRRRIRTLNEELEEKSRHLTEMRDQLCAVQSELSKSNTENAILSAEVNASRIYKDELDAVKELTIQTEKQRREIERYKDLVSDVGFYKTGLAELRKDNDQLAASKADLEEQMMTSVKQIEKLKNEKILAQMQLQNNESEKSALKKKLFELTEEKTKLEYEKSQMRGSLTRRFSSNTSIDSLHPTIDQRDGNRGNSVSDEMYEDIKIQLTRKQSENDELKTKLREATSRYQGLEENLEQKHRQTEAQLRKELEVAQQEISEQRSSMLSSETECKLQFRGDSNRGNSVSDEMYKDIKSQLTRKQSENDELKTKLRETTSRYQGLEENLEQKYRQTETRLRKELEVAQQELSEQRICMLSSIIEGDGNRGNSVSDEMYEDIKSQLTKKQSENDELKTKLRESISRYQGLEENLKQKHRQTEAQLRKELEVAQQELSEQRSSLLSSATEGDDNRGNSVSDEMYEDIKNQLTKNQAENDELTTKLREATSRYQGLEKNLEQKLRQTEAQLRKELEVAQQELSEQQQRSCRLSKDLEQKENQIQEQNKLHQQNLSKASQEKQNNMEQKNRSLQQHIEELQKQITFIEENWKRDKETCAKLHSTIDDERRQIKRGNKENQQEVNNDALHKKNVQIEKEITNLQKQTKSNHLSDLNSPEAKTGISHKYGSTEINDSINMRNTSLSSVFEETESHESDHSIKTHTNSRVPVSECLNAEAKDNPLPHEGKGRTPVRGVVAPLIRSNENSDNSLKQNTVRSNSAKHSTQLTPSKPTPDLMRQQSERTFSRNDGYRHSMPARTSMSAPRSSKSHPLKYWIIAGKKVIPPDNYSNKQPTSGREALSSSSSREYSGNRSHINNVSTDDSIWSHLDNSTVSEATGLSKERHRSQREHESTSRRAPWWQYSSYSEKTVTVTDTESTAGDENHHCRILADQLTKFQEKHRQLLTSNAELQQRVQSITNVEKKLNDLEDKNGQLEAENKKLRMIIESMHGTVPQSLYDKRTYQFNTIV